MPTTVSIREAKARLSELVERVNAGEVIVVTRRGKPVMQMSRPQQPRQAVNLKALRKLTDAMPRQEEKAGDLVRRLREDARY